MEGRYGFSEGFPEGKSEGWNGRPKACPPGGGGKGIAPNFAVTLMLLSLFPKVSGFLSGKSLGLNGRPKA